jgi:hypothetical protein
MKRKVLLSIGGVAISILLSIGTISNKAIASEQGCLVNPIPWHCGYFDFPYPECWMTNQCIITCYGGCD